MDRDEQRRGPDEFPRPGWYRDALNPTQERYWDGEVWLMDNPGASLWNEVEEIEPQQQLTMDQLRTRPDASEALYGETVRQPLEVQQVVRLGLWILTLSLMIALPLGGPLGWLLGGVVGLIASGASVYDRNRTGRSVGYVPLVALAGAVLFITGIILSFVNLAVHAQLTDPNTIFSGAPGLGGASPSVSPRP